MRLALEQARLAEALGEVPVGSVVVRHLGDGDGSLSGWELVSQAHNRRETSAEPSAHAEFLAVTAAARALGRWRLEDCTVYVTLEPCVMCAGLLQQARVAGCVYAAADPKAGALGSLYNIHTDSRLNHNFTVRTGVCERDSAELLSTFFAELRQKVRFQKAEPG